MELNLDNETHWTYEVLTQEIEGFNRYIRNRDNRWSNEDKKRDAYRAWQLTQVSGAELERLKVNWTRSDKARIKYRVESRKNTEEQLQYRIGLLAKLPHPPCNCAKEDVEFTKRRKKEDLRLANSRIKEDTLKSRKRKAQDDRIAKKRLEQDACDKFERAKQDDEIAARRACEDKERNVRHKGHDTRSCPCGPLGSAPTQDVD